VSAWPPGPGPWIDGGSFWVKPGSIAGERPHRPTLRVSKLAPRGWGVFGSPVSASPRRTARDYHLAGASWQIRDRTPRGDYLLESDGPPGWKLPESKSGKSSQTYAARPATRVESGGWRVRIVEQNAIPYTGLETHGT
jgi:hypothetical protein